MAIPSRRPRAPRGVCMYCGCSEFDPCPDGCAWLNPSQQTICTACEMTAKAERQALKAFDLTAIQRSIFRAGFVVGWFGLKGKAAKNPYENGRATNHIYTWNRGLMQGQQGARSYRATFGPITNAPRVRLEQRRLERQMSAAR